VSAYGVTRTVRFKAGRSPSRQVLTRLLSDPLRYQAMVADGSG
jgi:hypothetical protein